MNKVITINLNGRAYQLEEAGYEALQNYLRQAEEKLSNDSGKAEIMADLEQAIAEKCDQYLNAGKTVITAGEAEKILQQMGPVQSSGQEQSQSSEPKSSASAKRLYQIREGAMIAGVCAGLAAYFDIDVTLVRILFVILALLTHGLWIVVYLIMMLVVPRAQTSREKAAAFGAPFTAQELIDRARAEYQKFSQKGDWHKAKREWREKMRQEKRQYKQQFQAVYHAPALSPFVGLLIAALSLAWLLGLLSLVSKGMILGIAIPAGVPLWVAILVWVCVYGFIMSPLKATRFNWQFSDGQNNRYQHHHNGDFFEAMAWLAFWAVLIWALWHYVPASHIYFENVKIWWLHFWNSLRKHL